jgi:hypothetical membrane protein
MPEPTLERKHVLPSTTDNARRQVGLLFVALGGGFTTVLMLAAAMAPNYDFGGGVISDLGVIPETALLFNAGLVLVGVVNLAGGYRYYRLHGRRWLLGIYAVAAVGAVVAGLFPLDTGAPHSLGALAAFVGFNIQALGTATRLRGGMRALSILAGAVGLVFVGLMIVGDAGNAAAFGPIGHGGTERMIIYPVMLWLLVFGGYLLGTTASDRAGDGQTA